MGWPSPCASGWTRTHGAGGLFVFANRRANRCKILWFDRTGACLLYKRLHRALFRLPTGDGVSAVRIEGAELATLLEGVPVPPRRAARAGADGPARTGLTD